MWFKKTKPEPEWKPTTEFNLSVSVYEDSWSLWRVDAQIQVPTRTEIISTVMPFWNVNNALGHGIKTARELGERFELEDMRYTIEVKDRSGRKTFDRNTLDPKEQAVLQSMKRLCHDAHDLVD